MDSLKLPIDVQILGGDLNSKPDSRVYQLPRKRLMVDSLKRYLSEAGLPSWHSNKAEYNTWGHSNNTWTKDPKEGSRIDYIWFAVRTSSLRLAVPSYVNLNLCIDPTCQSKSLSDHNAIEVTFRITEVRGRANATLGTYATKATKATRATRLAQ